jgi:NDP-sugar pyrophosphorylase family protein
MRGFILAAGFGTRLRPITDHIPKALVPLAGKPLLGHVLNFLNAAGIEHFGVNTHYLPDLVAEYCLATDNPPQLFFESPEIRGTGGALYFARDFLVQDDLFMVANVDIIARFNLAEHITKFRASNDVCRLLCWKNETGTGTVVYDAVSYGYRGTALETTERRGLATADFIGIALYRKEFLPLLTGKDFSITPVWRRAIEQGLGVTVGLIDCGYWRDIGTPRSLAEAHFDIIARKLDVEIPAGLRLDSGRRCCYPAGWDAARAERLGPWSWIEEPSFPMSTGIERAVVFNGASVDGAGTQRDSIYTPWGEIRFDG